MIIAGKTIKPEMTTKVNLPVAKLTSGTKINIPVVISRAKEDGPVLLLMAGLHGDEINSVDVVRSLIEQKINHVDKGTVICVPILNVFGFINFSRAVPDGKDVNRSFPGFANGSLASQIAYQLTKKIIPHCDFIIDFHTGGNSRFNIPQTRAVLDNEGCKLLAQEFNAPFTLHSNLIPKSLRETAINKGKTIIVYEGGESLRLDENALNIAVSGTKKVLNYLQMKSYNEPKTPSITKYKRTWLRAPNSGLFHPTVKLGDKVKKDDIIGTVSSPIGDYQDNCLSKKTAHVITLNNNPMVNRGDAIIQLAYD